MGKGEEPGQWQEAGQGSVKWLPLKMEASHKITFKDGGEEQPSVGKFENVIKLSRCSVTAAATIGAR